METPDAHNVAIRNFENYFKRQPGSVTLEEVI